MVIACDGKELPLALYIGVWDCFSNQQIVNYIREKIVDRVPLEKICEMLMDRCLAPRSVFSGIGCDNMTLMIIGFKLNDSEEEWIHRCARASTFVTEENIIAPRIDPEPAQNPIVVAEVTP
jgi:protein phosphatase 2C family protein 2/3